MTDSSRDEVPLETAHLLWNEVAKYEAMLMEARPEQTLIRTVARPEAVDGGAEFRIKVREREVVVHVFFPAEGDTKGAGNGDG